MLQLEFPNYTFKIKNSGNGDYIFDEIRKKYIKLTKEEWVRQNCVKFLINEKNFSSVLIHIVNSNLIKSPLIYFNFR